MSEQNAATRSKRFNETTGALSGGNRHPDRCVCQEQENGRYADTPHKHYSEPPYKCARCAQCTEYRPAIPAGQSPTLKPVTTPTPPSAMEEAQKIVSEWQASRDHLSVFAGKGCLVECIARVLSERDKRIGRFAEYHETICSYKAQLRGRERALKTTEDEAKVLNDMVNGLEALLGEREREVERLRELWAEYTQEHSMLRYTEFRERMTALLTRRLAPEERKPAQ